MLLLNCSALEIDVSEFETLFSAIAPKKDTFKASNSEKLHLVMLCKLINQVNK